MGNSQQRDYQKDLRRKRNEKAFLFEQTMVKCLAEVEREEWEWAIEMVGGNVGEAAAIVGIKNIPRNARALWGKSQSHALDRYRQWINRKQKRR